MRVIMFCRIFCCIQLDIEAKGDLNNMPIQITEEMIRRAREEAHRRDAYITHHFEVEHLTGEERDIIGFLGEFACCEFLGINWEDNIRESYLTIDTGDIEHNNLVYDVKSETLPREYLQKVYTRNIGDDAKWGRRLINEKQVPLLRNYDVVIFGGFVRGEDNLEWYPFGYLETNHILQEYEVTSQRPDGGYYPYPALPIKTSELKDINELKA